MDIVMCLLFALWEFKLYPAKERVEDVDHLTVRLGSCTNSSFRSY